MTTSHNVVCALLERQPVSERCECVRRVFEVNTFGVMAMTQAVIPQLRARRSGVIVNVTSSVTLAAMPLAAAYTASKTAIEGFTGPLAHELGAFGVLSSWSSRAMRRSRALRTTRKCASKT